MNSTIVLEKRKHSEAGTTNTEVLITPAPSTSKRLKHSEQGENFVEIKDIVKATVFCYSDIHNLSPEVVLFIFNLRNESGMLGDWLPTSHEENIQKLLNFCKPKHLAE